MFGGKKTSSASVPRFRPLYYKFRFRLGLGFALVKLRLSDQVIRIVEEPEPIVPEPDSEPEPIVSESEPEPIVEPQHEDITPHGDTIGGEDGERRHVHWHPELAPTHEHPALVRTHRPVLTPVRTPVRTRSHTQPPPEGTVHTYPTSSRAVQLGYH